MCLCVCMRSGCYFSGDGAWRSEDGYYQITGRMDDVINVSGHRLGTAEVEDAMVRDSNFLSARGVCFLWGGTL